MTLADFLTTFCTRSAEIPLPWAALYDDAAHGRRPAHEAFDAVGELAALQNLTGEARSQRTGYLLNVLINTPDPDAASEVADAAAPFDPFTHDIAKAFGDDATCAVDAPQPTSMEKIYLSEADIAGALAGGEDPLALNLATARYNGPCQGRADHLLALAQICLRFEDQRAMDTLLRPGAATVLLCERDMDVGPLSQALLRCRARPAANDFVDSQILPPAKIVVLQRDRHGTQLKRALQALSEDPALVIVASDPDQLTGVLAHLPFVHIDAPGTEAVLRVMLDVCSATGRMSTPAVRAALPSEGGLKMLPRSALLLAFREAGPMRVARRLAALVRQAGGDRALMRHDAERLTGALSAAAMAVVAQVVGGDGAVSIALTRNRPVVRLQAASGCEGRAAVTARLASLLAGEALQDIQRETGGARGDRCPQMRMTATRLALREAAGRPCGTDLSAGPDDVDANVAYSRDRALQSRIARRLSGARGLAVAHLRRNLAAVDTITAHLLADGAVDAATLADLLAMCEGRAE